MTLLLAGRVARLSCVGLGLTILVNSITDRTVFFWKMVLAVWLVMVPLVAQIEERNEEKTRKEPHPNPENPYLLRDPYPLERLLEWAAPKAPHGWAASSPYVEKSYGLVFDYNNGILWPDYWKWEYHEGFWRVVVGEGKERILVDPSRVSHGEALTLSIRAGFRADETAKKAAQVNTSVRQLSESLLRARGGFIPYSATPNRPTPDTCQAHEMLLSPDGYYFCTYCGLVDEERNRERRKQSSKLQASGNQAIPAHRANLVHRPGVNCVYTDSQFCDICGREDPLISDDDHIYG